MRWGYVYAFEYNHDNEQWEKVYGVDFVRPIWFANRLRDRLSNKMNVNGRKVQVNMTIDSTWGMFFKP